MMTTNNADGDGEDDADDDGDDDGDDDNDGDYDGRAKNECGEVIQEFSARQRSQGSGFTSRGLPPWAKKKNRPG